MIPISEHLRKMPPAVRPIVQSARRMVKEVAPRAKEVTYNSRPPRSSRAMWKLVRYAVEDEYPVAIGTFPTYAVLFFSRGSELDDGSGLLEGSGKDFRFVRLRTPEDAGRPPVRRVLRRAFALVTAQGKKN